METQRLVALFVFFFSGFLLWNAWQKQHMPVTPVISQPAGDATTTVPSQAGTAPTANPTAITAMPADTKIEHGERIRINTDFLTAEIDTVGGDLRRIQLAKHLAAEDKSGPMTLFTDSGPQIYVAQSGLLGNGLPTHNSRYKSDALLYKLEDGKDLLTFKLSTEAADGSIITKQYTFHRGSYLIDLSYAIENKSTAAIKPDAYFQFLKFGEIASASPFGINTFSGPAVYTEQKKFQKITFADIDKGKLDFPQKSNNGWLAMLQHYFVAAWLPKNGVEREFFTKKVADKLYASGVIVPIGEIAPGATGSVAVPLYVGPQEVEKLAKLAPGLDLSIDYGWLTVIASPLFKVLSFIHGWVGNWGIAIILLTCLIKLIFFPLSAASYKSMAKMKVLGPKLQKLKEQYGDDKQKLNQAMMELYKTEKVNPLGGCLPIVIQIPVFISLYWVLLAAVELRHAPFFGWIKDLSAADPFYVLPIIMGATMLLQTKLNPTPPDPIQAKVMMFMPIVFSFMFLWFPSGLVLYWTVNNLLSIWQQWQINRMTEQAAATAKGNAKR
ncbi:MAG: membrane protein insertase YidC [Burkholderiales bacterium]